MRTRFAPSPTGPLHLGHAYSALLAEGMARASGGAFLLRIEDIDSTRSRAHWEAQIYDDLHWLGLRWDEAPMRQSDRLPAYEAALDNLWARELIYPCHCTRRDIQAAAAAPQEGAEPAYGPDGLVYPGTCRDRLAPGYGATPRPHGAALRLDMARALEQIGFGMWFEESGAGPDGETGRITLSPAQLLARVGDVVLSRRDFPGSYHLSVVLDDAAQAITHVVRGRDLFEATAIHVILQRLLNIVTPVYHHHALIRDERGKRLAKRDDARAIATYREGGATPEDIRRMVGLGG
ncbi:tRNA glutamyl-Q(34) synthetase GluQRS [Alloyangia pacifica]|uniref:Glutamyl-Q tRNA(Asp) synthetase n=1 Tax=Alloyangia pacifica TaxID=311180 RepID=A0A1I6P767_9RHOB|nr:tRNA glutamyl-Q(34) synthetase GluQRS [Alloyangia pacifica]SDG20982.1 glutamyl-Q tRNA(Asp) synthetase [Alloyangia pacifica]SFS36037.1 glutamyl-Q tRNA(Asp) synthetase [Alloyangia pacifica]